MKWLEQHTLECDGLASGVNDGRLFAYVAVPLGEDREVLAERRIERGSRLYFRRDELSSIVFHKIDFHAFAVAVEVEVGSLSGVESAFHCFEDDQVLEETAAKRIAVQLFGIADSCERTGKSRIVEIKLGRFYEPLAPVLVPWRKEEADVRRVEDGEPFHYSLRGNSGVVGNGRDIENRADASDEKPEKVCEKQRVLDLEALMNVAFHVGVDVSVEKGFASYASRKKTRIAAGKNGGKHVALWQKLVRFPKAERKQCEYRASSGEGLAYVLHKKKVAGAGEYEEPVDAFLVHDSLYIRKQLGNSLNFVENRAIGDSGEECPWVVRGKHACVWIFKRFVGLVGEECLCKRRLARLPRSDNSYYRKFRRRFLDGRCNMPFNVHGTYYTTLRQMVQYGKLTSRIA